MARIIQIITLLFLSFLMMSASCDKGTEGCTDNSLCDYQGDGIEDENCACNYDKDAIIDDGSCNYPEENFDCAENCIETWDCFGTCSGLAIVDNCEICCGGLTEIECVIDGTCPECPAGEVLGCFGCYINEIIYDCVGICGGMAFTDGCGQCVGGLTDSKTIVNHEILFEIEDEIENCHYYDKLSGTCQENWALDCNGECFENAVEDFCFNCVGGSTDRVDSWYINVFAGLSSDIEDESNFDSITLGSSNNATDGYDGEHDIPKPPPPIDYNIRFYISNKKWSEGDNPSSNYSNYSSDIRGDEFKKVDWNTVVETKNNDIEMVFFQFIVPEEYEIINYFSATVTYKGESYQMDEYNQIQLELNVETPLDSLMITIYDICFL